MIWNRGCRSDRAFSENAVDPIPSHGRLATAGLCLDDVGACAFDKGEYLAALGLRHVEGV